MNVLEPNLHRNATMPIFPAAPPDENDPMPRSTREKRILIREGLEKIFGSKSIGLVDQTRKSSRVLLYLH